MNRKRNQESIEERWLSIEEIRLVSDLRIMHSKVNELHQVVTALKRHFEEAEIIKYADQPVLTEDIQKVDELYLYFVRLKEEAILRTTPS